MTTNTTTTTAITNLKSYINHVSQYETDSQFKAGCASAATSTKSLSFDDTDTTQLKSISVLPDNGSTAFRKGYSSTIFEIIAECLDIMGTHLSVSEMSKSILDGYCWMVSNNIVSCKQMSVIFGEDYRCF